MKRAIKARSKTERRRPAMPAPDRPAGGKRSRPAPTFLIRLVGWSRAESLFGEGTHPPTHD